MTEQVPPDGPAPGEAAEPDREEPSRTGVSRVDAVLDEVERLDDVPLGEHAAVFERAHQSLHAALDEPADQDGSDASGEPA